MLVEVPLWPLASKVNGKMHSLVEKVVFTLIQVSPCCSSFFRRASFTDCVRHFSLKLPVLRKAGNLGADTMNLHLCSAV